VTKELPSTEGGYDPRCQCSTVLVSGIDDVIMFPTALMLGSAGNVVELLVKCKPD